MIDSKLARVRWELGQTLLPEHLLAQEEALSTESDLRFRTRGLPAYGIAELVWSDTLLWEGVVSIQKMTLLLPSGTLLDVPGNAEFIATQLQLSGGPTAPVFCHILEEHPTATGPELYENAEMQPAMSRRVFQLVLSLEDQVPEPWQHLLETHHLVETMKLAEFEVAPRGGWQLAPSYLPPMLQIGASPFLQKDLQELSQLLEFLRTALRRDRMRNKLTAIQSYALQQCAKSVHHMLRLLSNLQAEAEIRLHPYYIYEALHQLYADMCIYRDQLPDEAPMPYRHRALHRCFQSILPPLKEQIQMRHQHGVQLEFGLKDGAYSVDLPPDFRSHRDVYFVIEFDEEVAETAYELPKLGSRSRLHAIHEFVLNGLSLQKKPEAPFGYRFGFEAACYEIVKDEEWEHILKEGTAAFYAQPHYEGLNFYLV